MKSIISIFLLGFFYAQAQTPRKTGPYELMSVLEDTPLQTLDSEYNVTNAFSGESVPKGFKLVVDKNFRSAPDGMYRVYAVPNNSEFNIAEPQSLSSINSAFSDEYEREVIKAKEGCTTEEANPYKCLPHFYLPKTKIGVEESLELRTVEAVTQINETVNQAVVDPTNTRCIDCEITRRKEAIGTSEGSSPSTESADCQIRLNASMVNCNSSDKDMRSWQDVEKMVCLYETSNKSFCPDINNELRRIEIVADIMGLDRRQMACMTLIESSFKTNVCSNAGACGITQFTPIAARESASRIKSEYTNEWNEFQRRVGGTPFPVSNVTADNIRRGHLSYGLFAMGVYLRDTLRYKGGSNLESTWKEYIQGGGNPRYLFHAQIAAYNWRPSEFDNITNSLIRSGTTPLQFSEGGRSTPRETDNYMKAFNDCMYSDNQNDWAYKGSNPAASKASMCNIRNNKPVCR